MIRAMLLVTTGLFAFAPTQSSVIYWGVSPDGSTMVFSAIGQPGGELTLVNRADGTVRRLALSGYVPGRLGLICWMADGRSFMFEAIPPPCKVGEQPYLLCLADPLRDQVQVLLVSSRHYVMSGLGTVPRGDEFYALVHFLEDGTQRMVAVNKDSNAVRAVASWDQLVYSTAWCWTRDGKTLYCGQKNFDKNPPSIWRVNADGTGKSRVLDGYSPGTLSVSPSGKYLAFRQTGWPLWNLEDGVYVVSLEDCQVIRVCSEQSLVPWSPTGDRLAFEGSVAGVHGVALWEAPEAGNSNPAGPRIVAPGGHVPTWSADGKELYFVRGETDRDLFVYDCDTGSERKIAHVDCQSLFPKDPPVYQQLEIPASAARITE